jgi:hypothetical protein
MKLRVYLQNEINGLLPKDIRKYIGAIVPNEIKEEVLWHKNKPPKIIYAKPYKKYFEIINYTNDKRLIYLIKESLKKYPVLKMKGNETVIKDIKELPEEFNIPERGLYLYQTRTPIILSVNPVEYKIVYATNIQNPNDLEKYIKHRIKSDIEYKLYEYFGIKYTFDDFEMIINKKDIKLLSVYDIDKKKKQGAYITFSTNYSLPRFVGYATGFGFGELTEINFKEF